MGFEEFRRKWRIESRWRALVSESVLLKADSKRFCKERFCKEKGIEVRAFQWWMDYIEAEDRFTFYRSFAFEYLERARSALELIDQYIDIDPKLRMPLIREAIISYSAPFGKSRGRIKKILKLDKQYLVPEDLKRVHNDICTIRDVVIAHCDLTPRDPKVSQIGIRSTGQGLFWEDYEALLPPFKALIDAVQKNLELYLAQENLKTAREAFQVFPDPPQSALIDPGERLDDK